MNIHLYPGGYMDQLVQNVAARFSTALRVASRFLARTANGAPLAKGDALVVAMKKGSWWTEMKRGVELEVTEVNGDEVSLKHAGWAQSGWTMKLAPGQDLSGKFKLDSTRMPRSLVVTRK